MNFPLLALRTADLVAALPYAFEVELRVVFDADASEAILNVVDYAGLSEEQRPHAEHLARWVFEQGGWARQVTRIDPIYAADDYGWAWTTTHAEFNSRAARLHVANNTPGPTESFYEMLRFSQERFGDDGRSQRLRYVFGVY